jgi:hypothetical protein
MVVERKRMIADFIEYAMREDGSDVASATTEALETIPRFVEWVRLPAPTQTEQVMHYHRRNIRLYFLSFASL